MKGDHLPKQDHIARLCLQKTISDGQIQATAFQLRKTDEYLSANWVEFLNCSDREREIKVLRDIYPKKLTVKRTAKIAILNVGEVIDKVKNETPDGRTLRVLHNPNEVDPSHSGIYDLNQDDVVISELILEAVRETHPARE